MRFLARYWNGKIFGLFNAIATIASVIFRIVYEKIYSRIVLFNLGKYGKGCVIQKSAIIRYPQNVHLGTNVHIGRNVELASELANATLEIGSDVQINRNAFIDFSGDLIIKNRVLISESCIILTHSHEYDPRSNPLKKPLIIEDGVWIGANSIILENVNIIGKNSIVAAGSIVTRDVSENIIVGGNPAKKIRMKT